METIFRNQSLIFNLLKQFKFEAKLRFQLVTATQIRNLISRIKALFIAPTFWVPKEAVREKFPNTEFFLVRIFLYFDWIRTRRNSVFGFFLRIEGSIPESKLWFWKQSFKFELQ